MERSDTYVSERMSDVLRIRTIQGHWKASLSRNMGRSPTRVVMGTTIYERSTLLVRQKSPRDSQGLLVCDHFDDKKGYAHDKDGLSEPAEKSRGEPQPVVALSPTPFLSEPVDERRDIEDESPPKRDQVSEEKKSGNCYVSDENSRTPRTDGELPLATMEGAVRPTMARDER